MIETKNKKAIRKIAMRYYKTSTQRNIFVILAIIMSAFLITIVFNLGINFYEATRKQQTMAEGTNRDIIITNPNEKQVEMAQNLSESKYVGIEARCAIAIQCNEKPITYGMYWKNTVNWEKQTQEAVENIIGSYPITENEIMLSEWTLNELGFENYQVGMEIPITYSIQKIKYEKIFYLSGYFKDYSALLNPGSEKFLVSEKFYTTVSEESESLSMELGITLKNKVISTAQMQNLEAKLMLDKNQGFYYNEELIYIVSLLIIAVLFILLLIMFCSYLLIYNILFISFTKEVQTYGLLKTLGMTNRQMNRMLLYQVFSLILIGTPIGLIFGGLVSMKILPETLKNIYPGIKIFIEGGFEPLIYVIAAIFTATTVLISCFKPVRMVAKSTPLDAIKFSQIVLKNKVKKGKKGAKPYRMAIYNISCNKKKSVLVFASLFLGITIFMIINTYTNSINKEDYIKAYMPYDVILNNSTRNDSGNLGDQLISDELLTQICEVDGVKNLEVVTSDTINLNFDKTLFGGEYLKTYCELWMDRPYEEVLEQLEKEPLDFYGCLIAINDEQLDKLTENTSIDLTGFKEGNKCLVQTDIPMNNIVGENIKINLVDENDIYEIQVAGIVEDNLSSYSGIAPNIYVSSNAIENFVTQPWIEKVNITFDESYNKVAEKKIELLIQDTNIKFSSRIEMIESVGDSKDQMNLLGNGLAILIAVIGLLNFINVIITNIYQREKDFKVLNYVGMTHKQIRKMLVAEGMAYGVGTVFLVLTLGMLISISAFKILKEPYMNMHFPFITVGIVILILIFICAVTPLIVYRMPDKTE